MKEPDIGLDLDADPEPMDTEGEPCKDFADAEACFVVPPAACRPTIGAARHVNGLTFLFKGTMAGRPCTVLFDTGASCSFISEKWLSRADLWKQSLKREALKEVLHATTADNKTLAGSTRCAGALII